MSNPVSNPVLFLGGGGRVQAGLFTGTVRISAIFNGVTATATITVKLWSRPRGFPHRPAAL